MLVNEFLEESAESYPRKVALICDDRESTFIEMDNAANSLSNALVEEGFQRQDRAVVYLDNSID